MSKSEEEKKEGIVKDRVIKAVKGSESVTLQAIDSAAAIARAGLDNAEDLSIRAGDVLLNATRRAINAGNNIGSDIRKVTKNMVKETIQATSEIRDELKKGAKIPAGKDIPAEESGDQAKSE